MELKQIEKLLEKYLDAETTIAEEKQLKAYFASGNVAPHLEHYRPVFGYYVQERTQQFEKTIPLKIVNKRKYVAWLSVAASVAVLFSVFTFINQPAAPKEDLGTYNDPEVAFRETQKALNMLSQNVNRGVTSMEYIGEYENTRKTIFKQ